MFKILTAEDNPHSLRLFEALLSSHGYIPISAHTGREALECLDTEKPDLALIDIMMPDTDGLSFVREIRSRGNDLPVIIVTAMERTDAVRRGFLAGADDLVTKPVNEEELFLRISALLRRSRAAHEKRLTVGSTVLDYERLTVTRAGEPLTLPKKEFEILFRLMSEPGRIFTRRQLMDEFWPGDTLTDERTVDVHVGRLRDRFRSEKDFSIVTVRGLGYKCVAGDV